MARGIPIGSEGARVEFIALDRDSSRLLTQTAREQALGMTKGDVKLRSCTLESMLILMVGLPGTGKSTLARALVDCFGGFVIDKDIIRPALFGPSEIDYTVEQDDFCQDIMLETAAYLLKRKPKLRVFLDGRPFSREYQRERVRRGASQIGTKLAMIECVASEQTALARIRRDLESGAHLAANRTVDLYYVKRDDFEREPLKEVRLTISSDQPLETSIAEADRYLRSIEQQAL